MQEGPALSLGPQEPDLLPEWCFLGRGVGGPCGLLLLHCPLSPQARSLGQRSTSQRAASRAQSGHSQGQCFV